MIFEPHNGYGLLDPDGEPWPFGYISKAYGDPVFELTPPLERPADELRRLVLVMTAAPDLRDALVSATSALCSLRKNYAEPGLGIWEDVDRFIASGNEAIRKAEGDL